MTTLQKQVVTRPSDLRQSRQLAREAHLICALILSLFMLQMLRLYRKLGRGQPGIYQPDRFFQCVFSHINLPKPVLCCVGARLITSRRDASAANRKS